MFGTDLPLIKTCLRGLSNIVMEPEGRRAFFNQEQCINRVLLFMSNPNIAIATEAGYVLCFAISGSTVD